MDTENSKVARLPPELIDRIIDYLHSDPRSLAACSLVCKLWEPTSRFHLFRRIDLSLEPSEDPAFAESDPELSRFDGHDIPHPLLVDREAGQGQVPWLLPLRGR